MTYYGSNPMYWPGGSGTTGVWQPYQYPQPTPGYYSDTAGLKPATNNLLKVTGPESAKAYPLGPNSTVALFDANEPIFYLKTTDDSGFATLRTFDFVERKDDNLQPSESAYATKDELASVSERLDKMSELLKELV